MLLELDCKGYRIVAHAVAAGECWNCDVMLRSSFSQNIPHRELVDVLQSSADFAEQAGERWARVWIDLHTSKSSRQGPAPEPLNLRVPLSRRRLRQEREASATRNLGEG